jgi:hypothetical protein
VGQGSRFWMRIPVAGPRDAEAREEGSEGESGA